MYYARYIRGSTRVMSRALLLIIGILVMPLPLGERLSLLSLPIICFKKRANLTVTVYQGTESQTDNTPLQTSLGETFNPKNPPKWIAVSPDLLKTFPYRSRVWIQGTPALDGIYMVMDIMHADKVNQVDILVSTQVKPGSKKYGKWRSITVYAVGM